MAEGTQRPFSGRRNLGRGRKPDCSNSPLVALDLCGYELVHVSRYSCHVLVAKPEKIFDFWLGALGLCKIMNRGGQTGKEVADK